MYLKPDKTCSYYIGSFFFITAVQSMICANNRIHYSPGPWFNIKMSSYQYRKSHCGDKTVIRSSYLHNGISFAGKMSSLYWICPLKVVLVSLHITLIVNSLSSCALHLQVKIRMKSLFHCNFFASNDITSNFCTCHNSTVVMLFTKFVAITRLEKIISARTSVQEHLET